MRARACITRASGESKASSVDYAGRRAFQYRHRHRQPGGTHGVRFGSAKLGSKMDAYNDSPASTTRRFIQDRSRVPLGDPAKMAKIMIDSVDRNSAPKRITLGSDSYTAITERLAAFEAQKDLSFSTDLPANA